MLGSPFHFLLVSIGVANLLVLGRTQQGIGIDRKRPCDHERAIDLPNAGLCVIPFVQAYNWSKSQSICEPYNQGSLYETPWDVQDVNRDLLNCLSSSKEPRFTDLWVNSVAKWQPQFSWANGTVLNKVVYCPQLRVPQGTDPVTYNSSTISIEYGVDTCNQASASYLICKNELKITNCHCLHTLDAVYKVPCETESMDYKDLARSFIMRTNEAPLLETSQGVSTGQILCATVATNTHERGKLQSRSCDERHPFLCNLGNTVEDCPETCTSSNCLFQWKGDCLQRVDAQADWFEASIYCNKSQGQMWLIDDIRDMQVMQSNLNTKRFYWIGVSNFRMEYEANSVALESYSSNLLRVKCGHLELLPAENRWQWSNSMCDQAKAFLCQFNKESFDETEQGRDVVCPWPITVISQPIPFPPARTEDDDDDAFPWAALIAALVALLVLLMCLTASCGYWNRRRWLFKGKGYGKKDQVAFVPYVTEPADSVFVAGGGHEGENMSHAGRIRSASSLSETGSQFGQAKSHNHHNHHNHHANASHNHSHSGMSQTAMSDTYANHGVLMSSKSLDRNHLAVQNKRGMEMASPSSYDERGFVSSYSTLPIKPRDYMILEGQMSIQEDSALRGSIRGKPEVTLVTDHADMNFTVNHASPHGQMGGDRVSLDRTLEEIHSPVSDRPMTLTVPNRSRSSTMRMDSREI